MNDSVVSHSDVNSPSATAREPVGSKRMFLSTFSMVAATVVSSGFGFLFWLVAARIAPIDQVGAATALISAMMLLINIGQFGFGTMLISEATNSERKFGELVAASLLASMLLSTVLTAVFTFVIRFFDSTLSRSLESWPAILALLVGVAIGAPSIVVSEAVIGIHRSSIQLYQSVVFSTSKLVLCWGAALVVEYVTLGTIVWSWVAGSALSMLTTALDIQRRGYRIFRWPKLSALQGLAMRTFDHNTINFAQMAPRLGVPIVAATTVGVADNAAFYAAWMIASFLYMLPTHLSTAMFAIAVGDKLTLASRLRSGLALLCGPVLIAVIVVGAFASFWLSFFGPEYEAASTSLMLLSIAYLPCVFKQCYIAVERVLGRLRQAGIVLSVAAVVEVVSAIVGGLFAGLNGIAAGYLIALVITSILYVGVLFKVLRFSSKSNDVKSNSQSSI